MLFRSSLVSNLELITAISNDINYDKIFSYQIESLANNNDLLIMITRDPASAVEPFCR